MAVEVTVWRAADGTLHDSEALANAHEIALKRRDRLLDLVNNGKPPSIPALVHNPNPTELVEWLERASFAIFEALTP